MSLISVSPFYEGFGVVFHINAENDMMIASVVIGSPQPVSFSFAGVDLAGVVPIYAIALFTPTIINELGYSAANAQLLSVPPFAGGFFTVLVGIYSDKYQIRGPIVAGGVFISLIGYIVLYTQKAPGIG
ncbi:hypothetical protein PILCRDRAFT_5051 [Piloderma croceum F 1598]|uniref:Major facilitator superfamily (MFS) profile domain-containing protein n=1 Tax=Piloderma croceum (strain F 1598) TaxID=765440 RepID=A0A0C3C8B4_PILCF|nr:hypothetical protein PILCRDRAFT_5051 [Piloderma croceum F 1598]